MLTGHFGRWLFPLPKPGELWFHPPAVPGLRVPPEPAGWQQVPGQTRPLAGGESSPSALEAFLPAAAAPSRCGSVRDAGGCHAARLPLRGGVPPGRRHRQAAERQSAAVERAALCCGETTRTAPFWSRVLPNV